MARHRYGLGTHSRIAGRHSDTADLSTGRTLSHALLTLDSILRRRPGAYAGAWLAEIEDIDIWPCAHCERDGQWGLRLGFPCDGQEEARSARQRALSDHLHAVPGAYENVLAALRSVGREWDDRDISTRDIFAALKPFLVTGGKLFVDPEEGRLWIKTNNALLLGVDEHARASAEEHRLAARVMLPLQRRWRSHRRLERVARRLGRPDQYGSIVLEARP